MKRRNFILLLGGTALSAAALGTGTSAFNSATPNREVEINVVSDDDALVRFDIDIVDSTDESATTEVTVTNPLGDQTTVESVVGEAPDNADIEGPSPDPLSELGLGRNKRMSSS